MLKKLCLFTCLLALAACGGGWDSANKKFNQNYAVGNFEGAGAVMANATVSAKEPNNLYLGGLQCGSAFLWSGNSDMRQMCFNATNDVLTGNIDEDSDYTIKNYEAIMLKTYEATGFMADDDSSAKQMFLQAYDLQAQNIQENGEEIEELRQKYAEDQKTLGENGKSVPSLDSIVAAVDAEMANATDTVAPMKDYANPYTTWMSAIYDGTHGDMNNAQNFLKRVASFAPENSFVRTDAKALKDGSSVWIVFENGTVGPVKERSLAPALLQALNIKVTIPDLFPGTLAARDLTVQTIDTTVNTEFLASIDSVVKTDLDKYKAGNIAKSVAFEVGKVAAATLAGIAAKKAAGDSPYADLLVAAAVAGVMSVEKPWDLRSWDSIPSEVQTARVNMPSDRKLLINGDLEITIPDDMKNAIVFIRIPTMNAKPGVVIGKLN